MLLDWVVKNKKNIVIYKKKYARQKIRLGGYEVFNYHVNFTKLNCVLERGLQLSVYV